MRVRVCSLAYPACDAYAPDCDVICGTSESSIFCDIRVRRGYIAHFKFEAMKDGMERVLKKVHPVQNVGRLLPFLPQLTESKQILLYSQN